MPFQYTKSLLLLRFKGLHFAHKIDRSPLFQNDLKSHLIFERRKSSLFATSKVSVCSPTSRVSNHSATSKVCLRSRAYKVLHKQNYRTFHHEKRGSDGNGTLKSDLDSKQQTPHTSFVYYSNIRSASGTYHVRTSSAVGVCPPGKWNERL